MSDAENNELPRWAGERPKLPMLLVAIGVVSVLFVAVALCARLMLHR